MDKQSAIKLIRETFENSFEKERFVYFVKNLFNKISLEPFEYHGQYIPDTYEPYINKYERVGKYVSEGKRIDILIVYLKKETSIERARTMQRNFIAGYLAGKYGSDKEKDAAVVAFVSPELDDWRFSLVKKEYKLTQTKSGKPKGEEEFTPARRYSFLVGKNEPNHTAQQQLLPILQDDVNNPTLEQLEKAFSVEKITKEFLSQYLSLYQKLNNTIETIVKNDNNVKEEFENKKIKTSDFSKKLLGQIVFLYFLQKKGWLGVPKEKNWGEGDRNFLRSLFKKCSEEKKNFFNDYLEVLFYNTLNNPRTNQADSTYSNYFDCKIPFLNGGLFEPVNNYDWQKTDLIIPNELFSNNEKTKEGDIGTGILDVFDRYNFTVQEDEPLEKEVALDPELLGKVFENLIEENLRKGQGAYYTPREIVHYMCQESLINYLATECEGKVKKEDIEILIKYGDITIEHDKLVIARIEENPEYNGKYKKIKMPESIKNNAKLIDEKLENIRVCDPAVGSGAFPVGMMLEIVKARNVLTNYISDKEGRTPYNFKRHCIENCIYGVDIDSSAIDIAKLRFWLSLIVDEDDVTKIKPLPNLDYKLICGNSLLGVKIDLFNLEAFNKLKELKQLFFNEIDTSKKQELKKQINNLIKEITNYDEHFDYEVYFSEVFHEKKGFDVVIGNPPYLEARSSEFSELMKDEAQKGAKFRWGCDANFITRGSDLLIYFLEIGIYLLSEKGISVFLTQNAWLDTDYGKKFQKFLLRNTNVKAIIDSDFKYFDNKDGPKINTVISIFFGKKPEIKNSIIFARYHENFEKINHTILCGKIKQFNSQIEIKQFEYTNPILKNIKWGVLISSSEEILQIISLLRQKGSQLNELSNYNITIGQGLNLKKSFIVDEKITDNFPFISKHLIPFMTTEDGSPFVLRRTKYYIINGEKLDKYQIKEFKNIGIEIFFPEYTNKIKPLLILPRGVSKHFCAINFISAYSSSCVDIYDIKGNFPKEGILNLWLFLNSSIGWLIRELTGRKNLGGGLLKAEATDLKEVPIYFNFERYQDIKNIFEELKNRQALSPMDEIDTEEHRRIDEIVFDYLGVSQRRGEMIVEYLKTKIFERLKKSKT